MQLLDADKAQAGTTIIAEEQTKGRGQRGNSWKDEPGKSILMSVVVLPGYELGAQFIFSAAIAVAVAEVLKTFDPGMTVRVKWPNDIILNDKKAGGILIENVLRGIKWPFAVIGLGLNVLQEEMPEDLPHATSLYLNSSRPADRENLILLLREAILKAAMLPEDEGVVLRQYNQLLYRVYEEQEFLWRKENIRLTIEGVNQDGTLQVRSGERTCKLKHGEAEWIWPKT